MRGHEKKMGKSRRLGRPLRRTKKYHQGNMLIFFKIGNIGSKTLVLRDAFSYERYIRREDWII